MTLSEKITKALTEAGMSQEAINQRIEQVENLYDDTADGFNFWAGYGKVRLYFSSKSNKNNQGHIDLINGTIEAKKSSMYSAIHRINENSNFEVK